MTDSDSDYDPMTSSSTRAAATSSSTVNNMSTPKMMEYQRGMYRCLHCHAWSSNDRTSLARHFRSCVYKLWYRCANQECDKVFPMMHHAKRHAQNNACASNNPRKDSYTAETAPEGVVFEIGVPEQWQTDVINRSNKQALMFRDKYPKTFMHMPDDCQSPAHVNFVAKTIAKSSVHVDKTKSPTPSGTVSSAHSGLMESPIGRRSQRQRTKATLYSPEQSSPLARVSSEQSAATSSNVETHGNKTSRLQSIGKMAKSARNVLHNMAKRKQHDTASSAAPSAITPSKRRRISTADKEEPARPDTVNSKRSKGGAGRVSTVDEEEPRRPDTVKPKKSKGGAGRVSTVDEEEPRRPDTAKKSKGGAGRKMKKMLSRLTSVKEVDGAGRSNVVSQTVINSSTQNVEDQTVLGSYTEPEAEAEASTSTEPTAPTSTAAVEGATVYVQSTTGASPTIADGEGTSSPATNADVALGNGSNTEPEAEAKASTNTEPTAPTSTAAVEGATVYVQSTTGASPTITDGEGTSSPATNADVALGNDSCTEPEVEASTNTEPTARTSTAAVEGTTAMPCATPPTNTDVPPPRLALLDPHIDSSYNDLESNAIPKACTFEPSAGPDQTKAGNDLDEERTETAITVPNVDVASASTSQSSAKSDTIEAFQQCVKGPMIVRAESAEIDLIEIIRKSQEETQAITQEFLTTLNKSGFPVESLCNVWIGPHGPVLVRRSSRPTVPSSLRLLPGFNEEIYIDWIKERIRSNRPPSTVIVRKATNTITTSKFKCKVGLGLGLFPLEPYRVAQPVALYVGRKLSPEAMQQVEDERATQGLESRYTLEVLGYAGGKLVHFCLDANTVAPEFEHCLGRMINHSDTDANCKPMLVTDKNGVSHVIIVAKKYIAAGQEFTYNYHAQGRQGGDIPLWHNTSALEAHLDNIMGGSD